MPHGADQLVHHLTASAILAITFWQVISSADEATWPQPSSTIGAR
jgi:hypothetical protein